VCLSKPGLAGGRFTCSLLGRVFWSSCVAAWDKTSRGGALASPHELERTTPMKLSGGQETLQAGANARLPWAGSQCAFKRSCNLLAPGALIDSANAWGVAASLAAVTGLHTGFILSPLRSWSVRWSTLHNRTEGVKMAELCGIRGYFLDDRAFVVTQGLRTSRWSFKGSSVRQASGPRHSSCRTYGPSPNWTVSRRECKDRSPLDQRPSDRERGGSTSRAGLP
jgi:hypothetical protein